MGIELDVKTHQRTGWPARLVLISLFCAIALALQGLVLSVEHHWVQVLDVQQIAGKGMNARAVLVDTQDRPRILLTSDRLLIIRKGERVCVSERHLFAVRWRFFRLVLPGYCRGAMDPATLGPLPGLDGPAIMR